MGYLGLMFGSYYMKIKVVEIYWDADGFPEQTIFKETSQLNKLNEIELMDLREDLIHEMPEFCDRILSKWNSWWKDMGGKE